MVLGDASATLVQKLHQPPPSPEIHPELVEEGTVSKVMLVGDCRQRRRDVKEGGMTWAFQRLQPSSAQTETLNPAERKLNKPVLNKQEATGESVDLKRTT